MVLGKIASSHLPRLGSIYVHWPFCKKICPYCDFNKYASVNVDHTRMRRCLVLETETLLKKLSVSQIQSIYFGGGTPSIAEPLTLEAVIDKASSKLPFCKNVEVSLEVNPTTTEIRHLKDFKVAGINRVSVGVQALKDCDLKVLGREHTVRDVLRCIEEAKEVFGDNVSIDLMFGRPGQLLNDWSSELDHLSSLACKHVSLYQLTMKRHTPMGRLYKQGKLALPSDDELAAMYDVAVDRLESSGLLRYEISNFAVKGFESNHNKTYWSGGDYIGVGPGAHGRFSMMKDGTFRRCSSMQLPLPENWMNEVERQRHGTVKSHLLTAQEVYEELILSGLRMTSGIERETFEENTHVRFDQLRTKESIVALVDEGLLLLDETSMRASHKGLSLVDSIISEVCLAVEDINMSTDNIKRDNG